MLFLRIDTFPLTPYSAAQGSRAKPEGTSRVSPAALLLSACQALGVHTSASIASAAPTAGAMGRGKGALDSIWLESSSGEKLCELSVPTLGTN